MICPQCGAEFMPGITACSDCRVALVDALPGTPEREPVPDSHPPAAPTSAPDRSGPLRLVTVLATSDPGLMAFAKSLLRSADIPFTVEGEGIQDLFGVGRMGFNPLTGPAALRVGADDAGDARSILDGTDVGGDAGVPEDEGGGDE